MILTMVKRNLKLFFRDRTGVFFSLLSVFIIIGLYALFLGDVTASAYPYSENKEFLINSWLMAGLLTVTSVTTSMGALSTMVRDRSENILKDFYSAPIKRWHIVGGYIISAFIIGVIMSVVTFILGQIYIVTSGGEFLTNVDLLKTFGLILLAVLSSSSMVFFIITFFKSQNSFTVASTVIGTLIGFLTGVYVPIGSLPKTAQLVIKLFPVSHAGALMRQLFIKNPMALSFANAPDQVKESFQEYMGVVFHINDTRITPIMSISVLLLSFILFFALAVYNVSRDK